MLKKRGSFPWYEWVEEFEWDDDEFEKRDVSSNCVNGQLDKCLSTFISRFGQLAKEEGDEVGTV